MIPSERDRRFTQSRAAAFFDLSPGAFRMKENAGYFVSVDGEDLTPARSIEDDVQEDSGSYKHRKYSLYDIRRIAHAFRAQGKLSDRQLKLIILRLDAFAEPILKYKRKKYHSKYKGKDGK